MTFWRRAVVAACVMALLGSGLASGSAVRAADGLNVDSWIELSSTAPAAGCTLEAAFEIRSGGYAVEGIDVFIGIFVDSELYSGDRAITDANGIAYITIDSSVADGLDAWVDVTLNDTYWWGRSFSPGAGDSCYDSPLQVTESGEIAEVPTEPTDTSEVTYNTAIETPGSSIISEIGFYVQERNLSCEYAAVQIATAAWNAPVSEYALDDIVGWSDNPHIGYRGDINGWWGNTWDYGVYAEPLSWALPQFGFVGEVAYTEGDADWLIDEIDMGNPVIVWLGLWGDTSFYESSPDGTTYKLASGYHVVVAYGYDEGGVYISDPAIGAMKYYDWASFSSMWSVLDGMALSVYPA